MNNPEDPMKDSMIRKGMGGIGNLTNPEESNKDWAKLSGRERDRILQSMSEGFPPEYRVVLERYYRPPAPPRRRRRRMGPRPSRRPRKRPRKSPDPDEAGRLTSVSTGSFHGSRSQRAPRNHDSSRSSSRPLRSDSELPQGTLPD